LPTTAPARTYVPGSGSRSGRRRRGNSTVGNAHARSRVLGRKPSPSARW
jgi:hypothetical protein